MFTVVRSTVVLLLLPVTSLLLLPFITSTSFISPSLRRRHSRAVTSYEDRRWPDAIIPYKFDLLFPEELKTMLIEAMGHWQNKTCIKFVGKSRKDEDFVSFSQKGCGCCSSVGRIGGKQTLSLASYCATTGTAIHELGHVIGFWHEHTRPDRDEQVVVRWENIDEKKHANFDKRHRLEIYSFGRPYDFASIMHYSPKTFSNGGGDTMVNKAGSRIYHQGSEISDEDALQARLLYECPEPSCSGFVIDDQDTGDITSPYYPNPYLPNQDCSWTIETPPEHRLHLEFETFSLQDGYRCSSDYLEIREVNTSGALIGQYCGGGLPPPIISFNSLWIRFHSDWQKELRGFKASYNIKPISLVEAFKYLADTVNQPTNMKTAVFDQGCVQTSRGAAGEFSTLDLPNGQLTITAYCSLLISPSIRQDMKVEGLHLILSTDSYRAYGPNCIGNVYELDDANTSSLHHILWSYDHFFDGQHSKWRQLQYDCVSGPDSDIRLSTIASAMLLVWSSSLHSVLHAKYYIDYDECLTDENKCEQVCENSIEGYNCSCYAGYRLSGNGHSCEPKEQDMADTCEIELTSVTGVVLSSSEPLSSCTYTISLPGHKILLSVIRVDLPAPGQCDKNHLTVRSNKKELAHFCTNVEELKLEAGDSITVVQYADVSSLHRLPVFLLNYTAFLKQKDSCIYEFSGSGIIQSKGFPVRYPPNLNCVYKLRSDTDTGRVLVNITRLDIEETRGCHYDRLRLTDGRRRTSLLIATLCGRISGYIAISSGRHLTLQFLTDSDGSGSGFSVSFSSISQPT